MEEVEKIKQEVEVIKERNKRVEEDKKWEQSFTRRALLVIFTYLAIGFYLQAINIQRPWLNAIVPSVGFLLLTLTLPFFKNLWMENVGEKKESLVEKQTKEKEENKKKILKFLENNTKIVNNDVEKMLGVSNATAERYLDELEDAGVLKQVGKIGKSVYYLKI